MVSRGSLPGDCPLTWAVIGLNLLTFLLDFAGFLAPARLGFDSLSFLARPWTGLTYPLVGTGPILALLVGSYAFWLFGGSLERAWGGRDYLLFLALASLTSALGLWVGAILLGRVVFLSGLWMPLAAVSVAWSVIHPYERLLVYFAIPLEGRWIGLLATVFVFFSFPFPLGLFALSGCAFAWWYVRAGRYGWLTTPLESFRRWRRRRHLRRIL